LLADGALADLFWTVTTGRGSLGHVNRLFASRVLPLAAEISQHTNHCSSMTCKKPTPPEVAWASVQNHIARGLRGRWLPDEDSKVASSWSL